MDPIDKVCVTSPTCNMCKRMIVSESLRVLRSRTSDICLIAGTILDKMDL